MKLISPHNSFFISNYFLIYNKAELFYFYNLLFLFLNYKILSVVVLTTLFISFFKSSNNF